MKARNLVLILLSAALGGCVSTREDLFPTGPASSAAPSSAVPVSEKDAGDLERAPILSRAVSEDEPEIDDALLGRSPAIAPGELQTLPLNPVLELLSGNGNSQTKDEAYQTLTLFGLHGMTRLLRTTSHTGGRGFRRAADFTDDLLQPDEEFQRGKRPPYAFGLEFKY